MLTGKKIFIIEDNVTNLAVISTILRHHNATIMFDRWGHNTLTQMSKSGSIDLILLDLSFPNGVTGYHIFDKIKANPTFANIPIVAVTASDPDIELKKVQEKGFDGYICKPIHRRVFPQQLAAILDGAKIWIDELA